VKAANPTMPPDPTSVTGAGGLLQTLGLPDSLGTDGFANALAVSPPTGVSSAGGDRIGSNDDDL
jgi:hypothetical protein